MKYNKGLAPVLIILIVIGVLIVSGGIYFLNKSSNYPGPENTGICGENGEFCPGTPGYEERMKKEAQNSEVNNPAENTENNVSNNSVDNSLKKVNIDNFSIKIPKDWEVRNPIQDNNCRTINCMTLLSMRGDLSYKLYNLELTTADKDYDKDAIYLTIKPEKGGINGNYCQTAALPCPVIMDSTQYPNAETYETDNLVIQTYGTNTDVLSVYNEIVSNLSF